MKPMDRNKPGGEISKIFKSLRADLIFLGFRHLARFCPLVPFLAEIYSGFALFLVSSGLVWFSSNFLLLSHEFLVSMDLLSLPLLDLLL